MAEALNTPMSDSLSSDSNCHANEKIDLRFDDDCVHVDPVASADGRCSSES